MKHILMKLLLPLILIMSQHIQADEITYESLANSQWTDHVRSFKKLFELKEVSSFLEFGVGRGTKYFLDQCSHVTSVELVVSDRYEYIVPWYHECIQLFKNQTNWSPVLYQFSDQVNQANQIALSNQDPEVYDKNYLGEVQEFIKDLFTEKQYDVAFVDPGIHIRGDLVNALFGYAEIIAAHDTNFNSACYGWYKIKVPEDYEEIICTYGSGITFWIKKTQPKLIKKIKKKFA